MLKWFMDAIKLKDYNILKGAYVSDNTPISDEDKKTLFNMFPCNTIDNYGITFSDNATQKIDQLFNDYVTEDTLVISTTQEHPSVVKNLSKCKNVYKINLLSPSTYNIPVDISKYKNLFIYIIGVSNTGPIYTPNFLFDKLKSLNKDKIMVLDDCQGMFLFPRNYSLFDYIIGTMHAIVPQHNTGIVLQKDGDSFGKENLHNIIEKTAIIREKREVLSLFSCMLEDHFSYLKNNSGFVLDKLNYHFCINDKYKRFGCWEQGIESSPSVKYDVAEHKAIFRSTFACCLPDEFLQYLTIYEGIVKENL